MKIGIYNKYLKTMGGGEKYIGGIAAHLSKSHNVDFLSCNDVDKELLQKKLNLDLNRVNIRIISDDDQLVYEMSEEYDYFINSTYFSNVISKSKKSIYLFFFPKIGKIRSLDIPKNFRKVLDSYILTRGFYELENSNDDYGKWSKDNFEILITQKCKFVWINVSENKGTVEIKDRLLKIQVDDLDAEYYVEGGVIKIDCKNRQKHKINFIVKTYIPKEIEQGNNDTRTLGIFINSVITDAGYNLIRRRNLNIKSQYKLYRQQLETWMSSNQWNDSTNYISSYNSLVSISKFTNFWVKYYFNRRTSILYPFVDIHSFEKVDKKKIILSVGRFFIGSHNKKQLELIKIFKKMYKQNKVVKDYELHLCGGIDDNQENYAYLMECKRISNGYPIYFHENISFGELKNLYSQSKIFWHGTGFGEDVNRDPDKFEHFGITTVEAMSAGVIPVVIGKAGQIEIVKNGKNGYLWDNEEELINKTVELICNDKKATRFSENAIKSSKNFSYENFIKRLDKII